MDTMLGHSTLVSHSAAERASAAPDHAPGPGKSTLVQTLAANAARPPLFEDEPEWEELGDEVEAPSERAPAAAADEHEPADAGAADAIAADAGAAEAQGAPAEGHREDAGPADAGSGTAPPAGMIHADGSDAAAPATDAGELPHRAQLEAAFGEDLGGIGVERGADLSGLGAAAAARGDDIAFAERSPSPELVAHEVAHVLQQRRAPERGERDDIAPEDSDAEHEAEAVERRIASGADAGAVSAAPAGGVHLKREPQRGGARFAKEDDFNRHAVKANHKPKGSKELLDRAGVRIRVGSGKSARAKDKWKLEGGTAARYRIVDGRTVEQVDTITDRVDIALNPAHVRTLDLPNVGAKKCVFVWARGMGAAWLPIDALRGAGKSKIEGAVNRQANRTGPARAAAKREIHRYTFKDTGAAKGSERDRNTWVRPNDGAKADLLSDYLAKKVDNRKRSFINVSQSLPQNDAAPIAIDFAQPGDPFFALKSSQFTREVPLFAKKAKRSRSTMKWVFGYLGKDKPDRSRRGWVPLRVLGPG